MTGDLLGRVVSIGGELYRAITQTDRLTVTFRSIERGEVCRSCGQHRERTYVVGSPLYKQEVKPVETIEAAS